MFEPTMIFKPFGEEGPRVVLCGRSTGNWNVRNVQVDGDHKGNHGLFFNLNILAGKYHFPDIFMPDPTSCNTMICHPEDLKARIQDGIGSVTLWRGVKADGVVLPYGSTGAIATADCPTIIAYCRAARMAIMAHSGMKSVTGGVVRSIVQKAQEYRFTTMGIFVTCGIAVRNYERVDIAPTLSERDGVIGNLVDVRKIISLKFGRYGVYGVMTDTVDTYGDLNKDRKPLWHSYRRGKTPAEKAGRNLVLVVNR